MPSPYRLPVWVALLLASAWATASPTPDDYRQCHRAAAAVLQRCLDAAPGGRHGGQCWDRSRQANEACYREQRPTRQPPPVIRRP